MQELVDMIKQLGFPIVALIFIGIAIWRVLKWVGAQVVLPIKDSHVKLVESAQKTNEMNAETLQKMGSLLESNEARDKASHILIVETHEMVKGWKPKE